MKLSTYQKIKSSAETVVEEFKSGERDSFRVGIRVWKYILLNSMEKVFIDSDLREIVAKSLGVGVYELSLKELPNER